MTKYGNVDQDFDRRRYIERESFGGEYLTIVRDLFAGSG